VSLPPSVVLTSDCYWMGRLLPHLVLWHPLFVELSARWLLYFPFGDVMSTSSRVQKWLSGLSVVHEGERQRQRARQRDAERERERSLRS